MRGIGLRNGDKVVIFIALILNVWLFWYFYGALEQGNFLIAQGSTQGSNLGGESYRRRVSLNEEVRFEVPGRIGNSIIEVRNGMARFVSSPCSGRHCIRSGWLGHGGDFSACLPNLVTLYVDAGQNSFDSINY